MEYNYLDTFDLLVSVIIPSYNRANLLGNAIESVLNQTWTNFEIIVVDDGSSDNTAEIAAAYNVKYYFQENRGLPGARNTGLNYASGKFICFLDSDDWMKPHALEYNIKILLNDPTLAMVSGSYGIIFEPDEKVKEIRHSVSGNFFHRMLEQNYIGPVHGVMYRSWVFNELRFDESLEIKGCEDYDLYFHVVRAYPVAHHLEILAMYRVHQSNMSGDELMMLNSVLFVHERQRKFLKTPDDWNSFNKGRAEWIAYYSERIYYRLLDSLYNMKLKVDRSWVSALRKHNYELYKQFRKQRLRSKAQLIPSPFRKILKRFVYTFKIKL